MIRACSKCGFERDITMFQHFKGKPSGQCRICKTESEKRRREREGVPVKKLSRLEGDRKLCLRCDCMKPLSDFATTPRGLGGVSSYCRPCFSSGYRQDEKSAREATAAYRARHSERHKAAHRVRMFEYRNRKKVTSDGTVTDEFLKELYAQEFCHYCLQFTELINRTVDHKVALAKEGHHSASNLVMACWTCNSSKRDLSEEDFMKRGLK